MYLGLLTYGYIGNQCVLSDNINEYEIYNSDVSRKWNFQIYCTRYEYIGKHCGCFPTGTAVKHYGCVRKCCLSVFPSCVHTLPRNRQHNDHILKHTVEKFFRIWQDIHSHDQQRHNDHHQKPPRKFSWKIWIYDKVVSSWSFQPSLYSSFNFCPPNPKQIHYGFLNLKVEVTKR